jgi:hypothetical protein
VSHIFPMAISMCSQHLITVIPSEVENGAAREAATWTGRPEAERTGVSESNPVPEFKCYIAGLACARHDNLFVR